MAESDEVVKRYQELLEAHRKAMVEAVEAHERYIGNWRAQKWEEDARELQDVEQKRKAMNDAWNECIGFREQHREHLKRAGVL
jgi:hypothetical protein